MLSQTFCNLLVVSCIMATTIFGIENNSAEMEALKTQVVELTKQIQKLNEKTDHAEKQQNQQTIKLTTDLDRMQSETISSLELFKKDTAENLQMLTDQIAALEKSALLAENQIMTVTTDLLQIQTETKSALDLFNYTRQLENLKHEATESSKLSAQTEKQIIKRTSDVHQMKNETNSTLEIFKSSTQAGSVYIRWGASECPNGADLLYVGYIVGGAARDVGAAAKFLCLPPNPNLNFSRSGDDNAAVYGAAYDIRGQESHLKKPVCAVCRIPRSINIMVSASSRCKSGWFREYNGYLMAGRWDAPSARKYICVDAHVGFYSSTGYHIDRLFYFTLVRCGALRCGLYKQIKVINCAVCSK